MMKQDKSIYDKVFLWYSLSLWSFGAQTVVGDFQFYHIS